VLVEARAFDLSAAFRKQMQEKNLTAEGLFSELAAADNKITEEKFCTQAERLLGEAYKKEQISLLCQHIEAGGIGKRRFQSFLQQYFVVLRGIALTDEFEISTAKTIRKAELDEVLELLEGPRADDALGVARIRAKSLTDGLVGWISLKGNQGTPFLQEVEKPFYACQAETRLEKDFKSDASDEGLVRALKPDEVLELLEGRKQTFSPGLRVKGKAISDGAVGWFTARDKAGAVFAEADGKYYSCTSSVAMTDDMDIKECKVLRKLAIGELFTLEEGPQEEKAAGITRVKGKALKDELVGWITIKGNAGTVYAEASAKHFCVLQEVPLTKQFPSASSGEEIRKLAKGEAMQVLEGPKEESYPPQMRAKVKATGDSAVGWITVDTEIMRPWTGNYTCKVAVPLQTTLAADGAEAVRELEVGETVELLDGPSEEGGALRMRARADKDGAAGWVTIRDAEGKRFLES